MIDEAGGVPQSEMRLAGGSEKTKTIAVGIILAALYCVAALIPVSPFIGPLGFTSSLTMAIFIAPLFGMLLGPFRGFLYGLLGGVIAAFVSPLYLLVPTVILGPAVSGLMTGLCLRPVTRIGSMRVPGPTITAVYLLVIIVLYEIPNYEAWWFMVLYVVAAVIAGVLQVSRVQMRPSQTSAWGILPLALVGTITDFSMMTMGAVYLLGIPALVFGAVIFPVMLVERLAATAISAIIAVTVFRVFPELWAAKLQ